MKILLLNPRIDAGHNVAKSLRSRGVAVLFPQDTQEAWEMLQLHGSTVDLAIIDREIDQKQGGIDLVARIKKDPAQADLPLILTSSEWTDAEFAAHQQTPQGAHAYLRNPVTEASLFPVIEGVLGTMPGATVLEPTPAPMSNPVQETAIFLDAPSGTKSELILQESGFPGGKTSIQLEAPSIVPSLQTSAGKTRTQVKAAPESSLVMSTAVDVPVLESAEDAGTSTGGQGITLEAPSASISLDALPGTQVDLAQPLAELLAAGPLLQPEQPQQVTDQDAEPRLDLGQAGPEHGSEPGPELVQELPYLFGSSAGSQQSSSHVSALSALAQPLGDAVVPGGAAQAPDVETLKKYLLLREQDVAALSTQLRTARDQVQSLEQSLRSERSRTDELEHLSDDQKKRLDESERLKAIALEALQGEITELKFQMKAKADKARLLELQVKDAAQETERLKERVRQDIRKIRMREKELENRLEIMKKDSEALIGARENKIIELKRKLDLIEFNMDLLQDQYTREKETSKKLREQLARAAKVLRVAGGILGDGAGKALAAELGLADAESGASGAQGTQGTLDKEDSESDQAAS